MLEREIYQLMNELTERGVSIIMISSELPEVIGMSDRVIVVQEGNIKGEVEGENITEENIMTLATGGNYMQQLTAKTSLVEKIIPFIGLILLIVVISIMNSAFLDLSNLLNLLRQVSINGLIAFGMTFVILTGGIDLSVGSILALSSAFTAILITSGLDPIVALIVGVLGGFLLGVFNGVLVTFGSMAPFIATLATMTIFRGLTLVVTDGNPITNLGDSYMFQLFGKGYFFGIPVPAVTMIIVFIILAIILQNNIW